MAAIQDHRFRTTRARSRLPLDRLCAVHPRGTTWRDRAQRIYPNQHGPLMAEELSMRRPTSAFVTTGLATVLGIVSVPHAGSAQSINPAQMSAAQLSTPDIPVRPYNPYPPLPGATPPTVLPPDLQPEIYRVRAEIQTIFGRYFAQWQALMPMPTYTSNPPTLSPNGYDAVRILGGLLNYDETISP